MTEQGTPGRADSPAGGAGREGGSLLRTASVLLRRRRAILGCAIATAILAVGMEFLLPKSPPPVTGTFRAPASVAAEVTELAPPASPGAADAAEEGRGAPRVRVTKVAEPDLWRITVTSDDPRRSRQVADELLEAARSEPAAGEPEWLGDTWRALSEAEAELARFAERHPDYETSAPLQAEWSRLEERIVLRRALVVEAERTMLARRVNEDPFDTTGDELVIVSPPAEVRPDRVVYPALLGFVVGSLLGILWVLVREGAGRIARRDPESYREFRRQLQRARDDLLRPWRMLRR